MGYPDSSNGSSAVWTVDGNFEVAYPEVGNRKPVIDNINWKFVVAVAIIAMAVSLLSGGLGGIPLGILITRALIGGVVFLILAIGLNLLLNRFFPEILEAEEKIAGETEAGKEAEDGTASPGSHVDIVLPAEQPEIGESEDTAAESSGETAGVTTDGDIEELEDADQAQMDNLDRFSGSFSEVDDDIAGAGASSSKGDGGGDHDPEELAQAIHTVIKRDEKG
ncbi:MAG: hypothetical protein DRP70_02295 [Spirochaetes bacterium]|nr:MAG: hypothetical protein DRP70_02295 [Spirochaetota bacterium]